MGKSGLSAIVLSGLWLVAVAGAVGRFLFAWSWWSFLIGLSSLAFIVGLILTLVRARPASKELPSVDVLTARRPGFWGRTLLLLLGLFLTFFLGLMINIGLSLMLVCGLLGLGVTIAWRTALTWRIAGVGLAAGLISGLGTAFLGNGDLPWAVANLVLVPPAFTGGALLVGRTQLGHVRLLEGQPALALKGFLFACVLALPASLLNLLGNLQSQDTWVSHGWQSLYAIVPAIVEETWARLFLLTFCYTVLRPATDLRPRRAVVVAVLISVLAWGSAHSGIDPLGLIVGSLLYGLPVALLMIKKDFEHAVGYHFLIDLVRFLAAFLS
jgi:Type II CAAX prenyl endopeptidase Rce1-like